MHKNRNNNWCINYRSYDRDTNYDIRNISLSWENLPVSEIRENLNVLLAAIGIPLAVVDAKPDGSR